MAAAFKLGDPVRVADYASGGLPPLAATTPAPAVAAKQGLIKIDTHVPLPPRRGRPRKSEDPFPFAQMRPGDSFFVAGKLSGGSYGLFAKRTGAKFARRAVTDGWVSGTRLWLVSLGEDSGE